MTKIYCILLCTEPNVMKSVRNGEKLEGYLIEATTTSLMNCGKECVYQTNCLSFNYNTQTGRCELNRNVNSSSSPLISSPGFLYSDKSNWINVVTDPCRDVTCLDNEKCVVKNDTGVCIKYDCYIPSEMLYSGEPLYSGTVTEYDAVYSCSGPGVVREDVTLTCEQNGHWVGGQCRKISSCLQIKQCEKNYTDGEFWLYPLKYNNTERVKIYCDGLNTTTPKEYVSLPKGNVVVYSKYIIDNTNIALCKLKDSDSSAWGQSEYFKVRVMPDTMIIDQTDKEFAKLIDGVHQNYGMASDCSLLIPSCGRAVTGYMMINTTNTGLIIDESLDWVTFGWTPHKLYYNRSSSYILEAKCGGYCGGCKSDSDLMFVLDDGFELENDEAIEVSC
ncbi:hypothetical protein LOTGIDRAFT_153187 [Lottia gigantea]|uniref:Apple domain-containing protein n=1 Tax=Lottia gigantea TaxID=225164 RepID=V4BXB3_LOTGI|nr:hypothetical protein LOTGIDRAFT_153187 [Lottia gigantea]ESO93729.1 hypothetical protein LOTGIDRAFT_153187 [Lottia gigantea]